MKRSLIVVLSACLFVIPSLAQAGKEEAKPAPKPAAKGAAKTDPKAPPKIELKTDNEKLAYALGADIGARLKDLETEMDFKVFMRGLEDRYYDREPALSADDQTKTKQAFFDKKKEEAQAKAKALGEKNKKEGEAYLAENSKKPGVKVTASGLQYEVLQDGTGETPKATDRVKVNYKGTLIDGTEFDSSYKKGQPTIHPVNGFIKGWTEALQLMKVGSKFRLVVPSDIAYGERGAGKDIGPNSVLIFELELLGIEPPQAPPPAMPNAGAPKPVPSQPPQGQGNQQTK
jgi:FKBP-type peptidyl-prolyl cis-trans isomerase